MIERIGGGAGRISRRAGIKLGLGGLAWAGLGGVASARQMPSPTSLCPIASGGSWPGTWIYYFSPCYPGNPPSCSGPYFAVASSRQLTCGCRGVDNTGTGLGSCVSLGGVMMTPPSKQMPLAGAPAAPRDLIGAAQGANSHDRLVHDHLKNVLAAGAGGETLNDTTQFKKQTVGGKEVTVKEAGYVKAHGRHFKLLDLTFRAHKSEHDHNDYPDVTIGFGQQLDVAKGSDKDVTPVWKSGKYAKIQLGPVGKKVDYILVGHKDKGDL